MKKVEVHKALPAGSVTPEAVTIMIKAELPRCCEDPELVMRRDANQLARALSDVLPATTMALLCAALLQQQASRLQATAHRWEVD